MRLRAAWSRDPALGGVVPQIREIFRSAGNHSPLWSDYRGMDCKAAREALSARLDGERVEDEPALEAHVASCEGCRRWLGAAEEATRRVRLAALPPMPDRTAELLAAVTADAQASRPRRGAPLVRVALALVGLAEIVTMLLVGVLSPAGNGHTVREVAAFTLAIGVGFLVAAARPQRAPAMAPLVGVAALALLAAAALDLANGHIHPVEEVPHVLVAVGWLLLHRLSRVQGPFSPLGSPSWRRPGRPWHWRRVSDQSQASRMPLPLRPGLALPQGIARMTGPHNDGGDQDCTPAAGAEHRRAAS
jgi:predicted anti-sigma-YlaC factor YlaD